MSLLLAEFSGLTDEDFDLYRADRWSNNLFNLGRMRTKERVLALAKAMLARLDMTGLTVEGSSEIPSVWNGRQVRDQWAYVLRDAEARRTIQPVMARNLDLATKVQDPAEHHRHALLYVRLDDQRLEVGLRLHHLAAVDLANLLGRAEAEGAMLDAAVADLPEDVRLDGSRLTAARLRDQARAVKAGEGEWLVAARVLPRAEVIALGPALVETAAAVAGALAPLFRFVLWTADNDHIGVEASIEQFSAAVEAREKAEEARREAQDAARVAREKAARARTEAKVAAEEAWRRMQAAKRRAAEAEAEAPPDPPRPAREPAPPEAEAHPERPARPPREDRAPRPERPAGRRPEGDERAPRPPRGEGRPARPARDDGKPARPPRDSKPRPERDAGKPRPERDAAPRASAPAPKHAATFNPGDRCRLTRGLFAGKEGEIRGPGKPGYYKVRVGSLEVNVAAAELEPAG